MDSSIGIIGGADGPTAIFVTGGGFVGWIFPLVLILTFHVAAVYLAQKRKFPLPLYILFVCDILLTDRVSKMATCLLPLGGTVPLLPGLVQIQRVHNYGAAWSSFSGARWPLVVVTAAGLIFLIVLLCKAVRHPLGRWSLLAVIGGGIGNLIDRIVFGYVVDMFDLLLFDFPVFNVADIAVVLGTAGVFIYYLKYYEQYDAPEGERKHDSENTDRR